MALGIYKNSGRLVESCECCQSAEINVSLHRSSTKERHESYGFCHDCYDELKWAAEGSGEKHENIGKKMAWRSAPVDKPLIR